MRKYFLTALILLTALVVPSTAGAAVRYAFQAELFGLTPAQRTNGATQLQAALDNDAINVTEAPNIDPNKVIRGETMLFADANFTTDASIRRVLTSAYNWASTRASESPSGRHSYVRLRAVDDVARTITERYAESPAWTVVETTVPMG